MLEPHDDFMLAIATVLPLLLVGALVDASNIKLPKGHWLLMWVFRPVIQIGALVNVLIIGWYEMQALTDLARPIEDRQEPESWLNRVLVGLVVTVLLAVIRRSTKGLADLDAPPSTPGGVAATRRGSALRASRPRTRRIIRRPSSGAQSLRRTSSRLRPTGRP